MAYYYLIETTSQEREMPEFKFNFKDKNSDQESKPSNSMAMGVVASNRDELIYSLPSLVLADVRELSEKEMFDLAY